jgi:dTDP-4-amino-4,6-dideoxygalactose transaminase
LSAGAGVPFCDLRAAHGAFAEETEAALLAVARSGRYVLGDEVQAFEREFAERCGVAEAIGVGSGTDALALILRAAGVGPGDEVLVPAYTAAATWVAVSMTGARPVGVDVDSVSGLIDTDAAVAAIGERTAAVIAVHLFGRLADIAALRAAAAARGLLLVEDAAHAAGVDQGAGRAGSLGDAAAFSFYPTKPLGCLGDGGAVVTADAAIAAEVRRLRAYGWVQWQGQIDRAGFNSRLDEIQAAVLRGRLRRLDATHVRLRELAARYRERLDRCPGVSLPVAPPPGEVPWHQFVLACDARDQLRAALTEREIGTAVHYDPLPPALHAYSDAARFPRAEGLAAGALSLPFDAWLSDDQLERVADVVVVASAAGS